MSNLNEDRTGITNSKASCFPSALCRAKVHTITFYLHRPAFLFLFLFYVLLHISKDVALEVLGFIQKSHLNTSLALTLLCPVSISQVWPMITQILRLQRWVYNLRRNLLINSLSFLPAQPCSKGFLIYVMHRSLNECLSLFDVTWTLAAPTFSSDQNPVSSYIWGALLHPGGYGSKPSQTKTKAFWPHGAWSIARERSHERSS